MDIDQTLKDQMKQQRLDALKRRFYELELDRVALVATDDPLGADEVVKRQASVQKAFDAINAL